MVFVMVDGTKCANEFFQRPDHLGLCCHEAYSVVPGPVEAGHEPLRRLVRIFRYVGLGCLTVKSDVRLCGFKLEPKRSKVGG